MSMETERGKQLVVIGRELDACLSEARRMRDRMISLSAFATATDLAEVPIEQVLLAATHFVNQQTRCRELLARRREVGAA